MALKNEKFECFLKRILDEQTFLEVKAYDQCVVLSKTESHTFRFVFLTNRALCLTDNPPKSVILSIPLSDLCEVKQVHDVANFLQRDLQEIAQHLHIKVLIRNQSVSLPAAQNSTSLPSLASISTAEILERNNTNPEAKTSLLRLVTSPFSKKVPSKESLNPKPNRSHSANGFYNANSSNNNNVINKSATNLNARQTSLELGDDGVLSDADSSCGFTETSRSPRSPLGTKELKKVDVLEPFVETDGLEMEDLHLYILNQDTIIFPMLKSIWREYLLNETLYIEQKQITKQANKSILVLFGDLKVDILHCAKSKVDIELIFKYFHELKTVAISNKIVQKLFWQDGQLFVACVDFFKCFLTPSVPVNGNQHADQVECAILIAETLSLLLQQSESLKTCRKILQTKNYAFYASFLESLLTFPVNGNKVASNAELKALAMEYFRAAIAVLYHLIVIAEQATWNSGNVSKQGLTSFILHSCIDASPNLETILDHLVAECVSLWSSGGSASPNSSLISSPSKTTTSTFSSGLDPSWGCFDPVTCVRVYRTFVVLFKVVSNSKRAKARAQSHYREEFKYYIRWESIEDKIPDIYPSYATTRNVVRSVVALMTGNEKGWR